MTLDAGGTHFVFSAIQGNQEIIQPIVQKTEIKSLDLCLKSIFQGFDQVLNQLPNKPVAISFAFPGPADYAQGIIGDLPNLACFKGGVPLGSILEQRFQIPVFINNDGDLFTYGEAICGFLPKINHRLAESGNPKQYRHLFGVTLGTGFGAGFVIDKKIYTGENSAAAEIWVMRNHFHPNTFVEEGVSIRAVRRVYAESAKISFEDSPMPKDIFEIAKGIQTGNQEAAIKTFHSLGRVVGHVLADIVAIIDGLIVIGGGLAGAYEFFMPSLISEMNQPLFTLEGDLKGSSVLHTFNLTDSNESETFIHGKVKEIQIPSTEKKLLFNPMKYIGVGLTALGTNRAICIGAYTYALQYLDQMAS
ncbi:ROK family protein [bacterium]